MAASEQLTINAGAALQLVNASSGGPIDEANACITFTGDTTQYTYTRSGTGLTATYVQKGNGVYTCANLPAGSYQAQVTCKGFAPFSVPIEVVSVPLAATIAHAIAVCNLDPAHQSQSNNDVRGNSVDGDQEHVRYADTHYPVRRKDRA